MIADCVNPIELTRNWWRNVAAEMQCKTLEVEFICSDASLHRSRSENRICDLAGMKLPDWNAIQQRTYEIWTSDHLILDTAKYSVGEAVEQIMESRARAICLDSPDDA